MEISEIGSWLRTRARIIDLTFTIDQSMAYYQFPAKEVNNQKEVPVVIEPIQSEGGSLRCRIEMTTQAFTHIDAPKHVIDGGLANDEVPLDRLIGEAVVIDLSHKGPGELVTAKDLEGSGVEVKEGDIVIIRTDWTDRAFGSRAFWSDMIGMSHDAGEWLIERGIKALVTDFYTDLQPIRESSAGGKFVRVDREGIRFHTKFIEKNIVLVDFVRNLKAISKRRGILICLPIKLKGTDGAPARVIVLE